MRLNSYPKVLAVGHKSIISLLDGPVLVEEKIDGSQFSMMRQAGELQCRSRKKALIPGAVEGLFQTAWDVAQSLDLHDDWLYRCEYLSKPKHNTLAYERIPEDHLIVFDICRGIENYLSWEEKYAEARRIGLECVPRLYEGMATIDVLLPLLELTSILGGVKVEGIVVKRYDLFTGDGKVAIGKVVREDFKETHSKEWKKTNPGGKDVLGLLTETYRSEARWEKAVQHLRDQGKLEESPRDIGALIKEVPTDILEEEEEAIKEALFKWAWPKICRGVTRGLPEWYKRRLLLAATQAVAELQEVTDANTNN